MTTTTSKYASAARSFVARSRDESPEDFEVRLAAIVAIADELDCGVWHASWLYYQRDTERHTFCAICGGRTAATETHALCVARQKRGLPTPVLTYNSRCGCNWEGCDAPIED